MVRRCPSWILAGLLLTCSITIRAHAGAAETPAPVFQPVPFSALPDFSKEVEERATKKGLVHNHGLVATINYKEFDKRKLKMQEWKLPVSATGFKEDVKVQIALQPGRAPLAVALLGFAMKPDGKVAQAWAHDLHGAGCHVLTFDSVFCPELNCCVGHGVAGHLHAEAEIVVKLVDAALIQKIEGAERLRERVSSVRILGGSYGGALALNVLNLPRAQEWPVDRTLLLSPPVRMRTAASTLDRYYRDDLPLFGPSLMKLLDGYTPAHDQPTPREESLMRAGIAYDFLGTLTEILKDNEKRYLPGTLAQFAESDSNANAEQRRKIEEEILKGRQKRQLEDLKLQFPGFDNDKAVKVAYEQARKDMDDRHKAEKEAVRRTLANPDHWGFQDYVNYLCAPAWKKDAEGIWICGDLDKHLSEAPPFVQVVMAQDDPLNDPEELANLRKLVAEPALLVLPHGGHLGYCGTKWFQELIKKTFQP